MYERKHPFLSDLGGTALCSGVFGVVGALIVAGVTAIFSGPVVLAASIAAGVGGFIATCAGAVSSGTSSDIDADWRASWLGGLPTTALLVAAIYNGFSPAPVQPPQPPLPAVTQSFQAVSGKGAQPSKLSAPAEKNRQTGPAARNAPSAR